MYVYGLYLRELSAQRYIGQTNNIERRLSQHNDPVRASWASRRGPWKVIFTKDFDSRIDAMKFERSLKLLKNKNKLENIIAGWRSSTSTGS